MDRLQSGPFLPKYFPFSRCPDRMIFLKVHFCAKTANYPPDFVNLYRLYFEDFHPDILFYKQALRNMILYNILAPYDNEQNDLLHRIKEDDSLDEIPSYRFVFISSLI